jgi:hypothetical protein
MYVNMSINQTTKRNVLLALGVSLYMSLLVVVSVG